MSTAAATKQILDALYDDSVSLTQVNMLFDNLVRKIH